MLRTSLLLLLAERRGRHGYELLQRLVELGVRRDGGSVYRLLRTLEAEGLVSSAYQRSSTGPPRVVYRLTRAGRSWLDDSIARLHATELVLGELRRRYLLTVSQEPAPA